MCERRAAVMNERLTSWGTGRRPAPGAVLPKNTDCTDCTDNCNPELYGRPDPNLAAKPLVFRRGPLWADGSCIF